MKSFDIQGNKILKIITPIKIVSISQLDDKSSLLINKLYGFYN